ncbi:MAG: NADH-quinone oxidoreductase subunit C [Cytophagales bacterium CG12_big_fil_rev_8_21_14_0_65_40_12]|nr:MAG: NADH-quinone oxidoreductase subunit C [Cytophagales bacterium CG12_big_fil_rev_8_21_14_0_65_40_12]PIW04799.1 MAG: NADH-quinone oxidoreductase subunit C [Cytophagales bacterium CG17_big_fil_post_rev_8_21_14_2_50_40_13]
MTFQAIVDHIKSNLDEQVIISIDENASPKAIIMDRQNLIEVMSFLQSDDQLYFDSLSCITGLDNGPEENSMEVIYNLYSIPFNHHLMVKVELERENPAIDSLTGLWKTADWHEREAYDLFGIHFNNHPDLRRILLPADWEGFPLKKDYQQQEYYRGVKVEY